MRSASAKAIALGIAAAALLLAIASAAPPPSEDFEGANPYWNGLRAFSEIANASFSDAALQGPDPRAAVLFVIAPSEGLAEERAGLWGAHAEEGGTLVLMDETEGINPALSALGLGVRVVGRPMLDAVFYHRSWRLPRLEGAGAVIADLPSALNFSGPGEGARVLLRSSQFSFLDLDGDGRPSAGEPSGPFPVAVEIARGRGRVVVISDSSLFINGAISLGENARFLRGILGGRRAVVDAGAWRPTPGSALRGAALAAWRSISAPELKYGLAMGTATVIYALANRKRARGGADEVEALLRAHPGWDGRLLEALRGEREGNAE